MRILNFNNKIRIFPFITESIPLQFYCLIHYLHLQKCTQARNVECSVLLVKYNFEVFDLT